MRRRYTSATTEAKNATVTGAGEPVTDEARRSEVNGRVTTPDM